MTGPFDLGNPVERAKVVRRLTACPKCNETPTFTQRNVVLRDQIRTLYEHHGKERQVVFYSFCCGGRVGWKPEALYALHLVLEGRAAHEDSD